MYPYLQLGSLTIPSYYLLISLGSVLGLTWFLERTPGEEEPIGVNIAFVVLISGFIGARLLHILFEAPNFYLHDPLLALEFWRGGFVFYGGLLAGLAGGAIYCRKKGLLLPNWLDRACLPVGLAYAVGRIGCFLNGCCYGRICRLPWAVRFRSHAAWGLAVQPRHPTQLYATGLEVLAIFLLWQLERRKIIRRPGRLFWIWLILHAVNRLVMENWRDDDRGIMMLGWSISSLISFGLLAVAVIALVLQSRKQASNLQKT